MTARDEKLKDFIDGYHKAPDPGLEALRRSNEDSGVPLIFTETEGILKLLLSLKQPRRILELGTAHGYSALFFAKTCPQAHITTIERAPAMAQAAMANFDSSEGGERIELRCGDAAEVLRELCSEIGGKAAEEGYDLVFIDAGKSHYREYLELAEALCRRDAMIVCDNILLHGWVVEAGGKGAKRHRTNIKYMKEFLDYISRRDDLDVTLMSGGDGLAVIRFVNG